ncbi:MAG: hypothetical protein GKR88_08935 [Flavobacteriaceae bacterium]|nr:MAG: hypothetical protein GKR88_08935 [Flavobacteriaceae bacterium]
MIAHFLRLEWRQYFRSSYWQTGLTLKIIMGFFAIYFMISFLAIGIGGYYIIEEQFPDTKPLSLINSYLLYAVFADLIFRYMMQKLPVMNVKPMLILPIKKSTLTHYVLGKSAFSFFNIMPLFFYVPFSMVLIKEGYSTAGSLGWLFTMVFITQNLNFLNFLINKNSLAFWFSVIIIGGLALLRQFQIFDITIYSRMVFDTIYDLPVLSLLGILLLAIVYYCNYKYLRTKVYLGAVVSDKKKKVTSANLSWADRLGDVAPFIKNDIRLIWRNKRTKTVFLISFLFVLYGFIFFDNPVYRNKMPGFLVFASLFVTGGFMLNYGQFIPAWDSSYYKMLMTQNIRYRKFLESKWVLMVAMTGVLYVLSTVYLVVYGVEEFLMITAGAVYNIGFNSLLLLYAGSFNRKRIDLEKSGFSNMQGTSAAQFIIIIPVMVLPMLLFWLFSSTIHFNAGLIAIATFGMIPFIFKNDCMRFIEAKYIREKYIAIKAFNQKA